MATAPTIAAAGSRRSRSVVTTLLFAVTAFLGAPLLFFVEPMVARFVLPPARCRRSHHQAM